MFDAADALYVIVVKAKEQYSIWPEGRKIPFDGTPKGSAAPGTSAWPYRRSPDARWPLRLRKKMDEDAARQADKGG